MRHAASALFTLLAAALMPATAWANAAGPAAMAAPCQLSVTSAQSAPMRGYDALSRTDYVAQLDYIVRNVGTGSCVGSLAFEDPAGAPGGLSGSGTQVLEFSLADPATITRPLWDSQTGTRAQLSVALTPGDTVTLRPHLVIARYQQARSGTYSRPLDLVFREVGPVGLGAEIRRSVTPAVRVRSSVQANFTGTDATASAGGMAGLDLGVLTPGLRRDLGLQLRANTDVDVQITSDNAGQLAHETVPGAAIPYTLDLAGSRVDLSATQSIAVGAGLADTGRTAPITIEIGAFDRVPAGAYSDVVRVRVSAR